MKKVLLLAALAVTQMGSTSGGCNNEVLRDPGFDLWCGDQLCAWKVERGQVMRVPTWHESDAGVELDGTDVAIEQLTPVNSSDAHCIHFDLVADVDDAAEVYLNVDIQSDGSLEMHERLPTSNWKPLTYDILISGPYDGIRFELTKRGTGRAVLANIEATTDGTACDGLTPLDPGKRKDGSTCLSDADCASGICGPSPVPPPHAEPYAGVCKGCDADHGCAAGSVCGVADPVLPILPPAGECELVGTRELGERCVAHAECASGICARDPVIGIGSCSACSNASDCGTTGGNSCGPSWPAGPLVCNPGQHTGAPRAPCGTDDDCASGSCAGAMRSECSDGRACTSPADCPFGPTGMDGLKNGACVSVGVQGGTCD